MLMADQSADVRAARLALARALARPGAGEDDLEEAERLLLLIPVPTAPEDPRTARWEILGCLAEIARLRGQSQREFESLARAVTVAPPAQVPAMADRLMTMLAGEGGERLVEGVPATVAAALWEAAHDPQRPDAVVQLVAKLALARGHVVAASEVSQQRSSVVSASPELQVANEAASALQRLRAGDLDAAESVLHRVRHLRDEPSVAMAEALLLYARGDVSAARDRAESSPGAGDLTAVAVIAMLHEAVTAGDAQALYKTARSAATRAARLAPSSADPGLLRAQVLLESGTELDLGRELLRKALRKIKHLGDLPWWQVQDRVRDDDHFHYFMAEVAAARGDGDEVNRRAAAFAAQRTSFAQDARLRELWAGAAASPAEQAERLRAAATDFRRADDQPNEERCLRLAYERQPTSTYGLDLVETLWTLSFADPQDQARSRVDEAKEVLLRLEGEHPTSSLGRACLLWGLLLTRADDLPIGERRERAERRWLPLPHLLVSALLAPEASYRWAHLSLALGEARLTWPATWASRRASELRPDDPWLQETRVVAEANWSGTVDTDQRVWLRARSSEPSDAGWASSLLALDLLAAGRAADAADLAPQMTFPAPWSHEIRVAALALGSSVEAALKEVYPLVDELAQHGDLLAAAWWALLVDPDWCRQLVDAEREGGSSPFLARLVPAVFELVTQQGDEALDRLVRSLAQTARPSHLRDWALVRLPILVATLAPGSPLRATVTTLAAQAERLLHALPERPPLTVELDSDDARCHDPSLLALVRVLLDRADDVDRQQPPALPGHLPGAATLAAAWRALDQPG